MTSSSGGWCGNGGPRLGAAEVWWHHFRDRTRRAGHRSLGRQRTRHGRRPGDRAAQPHALRRGLRHLPLRRGVALRRGDPLLPAGARCRPRRDDDDHAGAGRPARGPWDRGAAAGIPADLPDRQRRGRRRGGRGRVPARGCGGGRPPPARARAARRRRRSADAVPGRGGGGEGRADGVGRHPRRPADARDPPRNGPAARRGHPLAPPPLRLGRGLLAAGVRLRPGDRR